MRQFHGLGILLALALVPINSSGVGLEVLADIDYERQQRCRFDIAARAKGKVAPFTELLNIPVGLAIEINFDLHNEQIPRGTEAYLTNEDAKQLEGRPLFFQDGKMLLSGRLTLDQPYVIFLPDETPPEYFSPQKDHGFAKPTPYVFNVESAEKSARTVTLPGQGTYQFISYLLTDTKGHKLALEIPRRLSEYRIIAAGQQLFGKRERYYINTLLRELGSHADLGDRLVEPEDD